MGVVSLCCWFIIFGVSILGDVMTGGRSDYAMFHNRLIPFVVGLMQEDFYADDGVQHVLAEPGWLDVSGVNGK